jgi:signal transduction histidine kinase
VPLKSMPTTRTLRLHWCPAVAVALLLIQTALSVNVRQSGTLTAYTLITYFLVLVLAAGIATLNAVQSSESIRLFWSFLAMAFGSWSLSTCSWIYYMLVLGRDRPATLGPAIPLYLHIVFMIAAAASRPHLKLLTHRRYRTALNFLLLLFFWVFAYAFLWVPHSYTEWNVAFFLRGQALYLVENFLLLVVLGVLIVRAQPPWKSIYRHLLGASALYILGSSIANYLIVYRGYYVGLKDIPYTAAACWFVWVALLGRKLAPQLAQSVQPQTGDSKYATLLTMVSMLSVLVVPIAGVWELLRPDEPYRTRVIRLLIVLISVVLLAVFVLAKEYLANRELSSDVGLANERLHLAVNAGRMYAFEWDAETDVIVRSEQSAEILNWIDAGTGRLFIARVHPDDRAAYVATETGPTPDNPTYQTSYKMLCPDGGTVWLEESGHAFFNDKGRMLRIIGMVSDVTERKLAEEALSGASRRLIEAQERERARIARELHDDIGQRLALLTIELEQLRQNLPNLPVEVRDRFGELQKQTAEVASDVQSMSHQLHSSKLEYLGIATAMSAFCREFSQQQNVEVVFAHDAISRTVPSDISLCLFRVLQEALHNAFKYSGVRRFDAELRESSDAIYLTVRDSGSGFDVEEANKNSGLGLISMAERVKLVNGELSIDSQPKHGTTIHARVPFSSGHYSMRAAG